MITTTIQATDLVQALLELNEQCAHDIISDSFKLDPTFSTTSELITETFNFINASWEEGNLSLAQIYLSALMCEKLVDKFAIKISSGKTQTKKIGIAVFQDFHLLGKKIVSSTLRANGIEVVDLGGGLSIDQVVSKVKSNQINILLISVLMLSSALKVKELIKALSHLDVTLLVGGAPFRLDKNLAYEVGAKFNCKDASDALKYVNDLL